MVDNSRSYVCFITIRKNYTVFKKKKTEQVETVEGRKKIIY